MGRSFMILGKCQENPSDVKEKTNKKAKVFFFVRQSGGGKGGTICEIIVFTKNSVDEKPHRKRKRKKKVLTKAHYIFNANRQR